MTTARPTNETVHVACSTWNGARWLPAFLESMQAQTHADWLLWVRDDGSSDDTVAVVRHWAESDARIRLLAGDHQRRGAAQSFGAVLQRIPHDARWLMCADQDDVWLPGRIALSLEAMRREEARAPGAILVHTDLAVVDAALRPVHPSFWAYSGFDPDPATVTRLAVRNVVTGAAAMFNAPLRRLAMPLPPEAMMHDWWLALVAAAAGRIVALRQATVLYRQHGGNAVGARDGRHTLRRLPAVAANAWRHRGEFRRQLSGTAAQADALLRLHGQLLTETDRLHLARLARIPARPWPSRVLDLLRYRALPEHGLLRRLGIVLRG
jgi:hypothetical protein